MADDPAEVTRLELTRQVLAIVQSIERSLSAIGGKVESTEARSAKTHESQIATQATLGQLTASSMKTASGIDVMAALATKQDERETKRVEREDKASENRWAFLSNNWKIILLGVALVATGNIETLKSLVGLSAPQVQTVPVPVPYPVPVATPVEHGHELEPATDGD